MSIRKWQQRDVKSVVVKTAQVWTQSKIAREMLCFTIETAAGGREGRMCPTGGCGLCPRYVRTMSALCSHYVRTMFARDRNGRRVQSSRKGKQCAAYYWGMPLQIARRIGRRVQRSRKGKQCAAYYWGMQLQIARRIGRRAQWSRKGKQCAAYY